MNHTYRYDPKTGLAITTDPRITMQEFMYQLRRCGVDLTEESAAKTEAMGRISCDYCRSSVRIGPSNCINCGAPLNYKKENWNGYHRS